MPRLQINLVGTSARAGASWTITTQWALSTMPTPGALATALANARTALAASTGFKNGIGSNYSLITLHGIAYATPTGPASFTADASGAAIAGAGSMTPIPLACVVSELTAAAGPSFRGRSYWPLNPGSADGSIAGATQSQASASWLAMHNAVLTALQGMGGSPVHVVFSRKTGDMTPITVIRTGNRTDTARGRFGDAPESYTSTAVPNALAVTPAPAAANEVSPEALGLPPDATPEETQAFLDKLMAKLGPPANITLGPLDELFDAAITYLAAKQP